MLNANRLVRQFENARFEVFYASIREEDWEKALSEPVDRVVIAGGDGTVRRMAKEYPEIKCELQLDDETIAGHFLLLEIANMPLVGPNLQLVPDADPADGWFDVMWIEGTERKALRDYLELCGRDERAIAPAKTRRCQRVLFRYADAPA